MDCKILTVKTTVEIFLHTFCLLCQFFITTYLKASILIKSPRSYTSELIVHFFRQIKLKQSRFLAKSFIYLLKYLCYLIKIKVEGFVTGFAKYSDALKLSLCHLCIYCGVQLDVNLRRAVNMSSLSFVDHSKTFIKR